MWPFYGFVLAHIATGAFGLVTFWITVLSQKGGPRHKTWGRVFIWMMLTTGTIAVAISLCTLTAPLETHPHLKPELRDPALIRGIFGWMMLYLAILTINLAWHGWHAVTNKRDHARNLEWRNLALQAAVTISAANCAYQGWLIDQPLMIGISAIGFATAGTNLYFLYKPERRPHEWVNEHIKALVGAGISVYTAFFAFGAVRLMPELALHPGLWAVPLVTGLAIIIYHQREVTRRFTSRKSRMEAAS